MARVVLLTGGNVGDVKERLRTAQRLVNARIGAVLRCSHCYGCLFYTSCGLTTHLFSIGILFTYYIF